MEREQSRANIADLSTLLLRQRVGIDIAERSTRSTMLDQPVRMPIQSSMTGMLGLMSKPGWCLNMLRTLRRSFGNIIGHTTEVTDLQSLAAWTAQQIDPSITWDDVSWLRRRRKGKLVLKGIMDAEDAKTAVAQGVDGIIVSNHAGRQLDGTSSSARALQNVVEAVSGKLEVHVDGGIRCGQDVLRMLALGADAVYIGRPYLYGLGAMGESGVLRCLEIIENELDLTMAFCGVQRLDSGSTDVLLNKFS